MLLMGLIFPNGAFSLSEFEIISGQKWLLQPIGGGVGGGRVGNWEVLPLLLCCVPAIFP